MTNNFLFLNGRDGLRRSDLPCGAVGLGALSRLLAVSGPARAADCKALVCIFPCGGNDGMNMVVPTDATPPPDSMPTRSRRSATRWRWAVR